MESFVATILHRSFAVWVFMVITGTAQAHPDAQVDPGALQRAATHSHVPGEHGKDVGEPVPPETNARSLLVTMNDAMRFIPGRLSVARGETLRFIVRNSGKLKHEFVLGTEHDLADHAKLMQQFPEMEHEDPNAITIEPQKTGVLLWKFSKAGEVTFACLVPGHFEAGMKGTVVVK